MKYSKKIFLSNIDYLIKKNNIKIGELENLVKVSTGYFSRLKNNDNDSLCPSIDIISSIAEKLYIPINILLFVDLSKRTPDECYIMKFIEELMLQTQTGKLGWLEESIAKFYDINNKDNVSNPLVSLSQNSYNESSVLYKSLFTDEQLKLTGPVYKLVRVRRDIYITEVAYDSELEMDANNVSICGYEMYFIENNYEKSIHKICGMMDNGKDTEIFYMMKNLYGIIKNSQDRSKLDNESKKGIEEFLSGEDDMDYDLPF